MQQHHRTAPDHNRTGWPPGIGYIIGNEGCERFSYYGMRATLYMYVSALYVNMLWLNEQQAGIHGMQAMRLFFVRVDAPLMIAVRLAVRYWVKLRSIMNLSIICCLGPLALAVFEDAGWQQRWVGTVLVSPRHWLYLGLAMIAI